MDRFPSWLIHRMQALKEAVMYNFYSFFLQFYWISLKNAVRYSFYTFFFYNVIEFHPTWCKPSSIPPARNSHRSSSCTVYKLVDAWAWLKKQTNLVGEVFVGKVRDIMSRHLAKSISRHANSMVFICVKMQPLEIDKYIRNWPCSQLLNPLTWRHSHHSSTMLPETKWWFVEGWTQSGEGWQEHNYC